MEKYLIQCVRGILKSIKMEAKLYYLRHEIFLKLCTLNKLVIYTFLDLGEPSPPFLGAIVLQYVQISQYYQNSIFSNEKFIFFKSFSLIN